MRFGKCMGTLGGLRSRLYEIWDVYGHPRWVIGGRLYDLGKCIGTLWDNTT